MSDNPQWDYLQKIWNADALYRKRMEPIRDNVRMEETARGSVDVFGKSEKMPNNGRGLSTVMQYRAFATRYPPVDVISKDDSKAEQAKAQKIQQHLQGVPYMVSRAGKDPYVDSLYFSAEVGRALLYTRFDEVLATNYKYPLRVEALDPLCVAPHEGTDGLLAAVVHETYGAQDLYTTLQKRWEAAQEYKQKASKEIKAQAWSVPAELELMSREDPLREVETWLLLTEELCAFYVKDQKTYEYPLLVKGVPIELAYCMDIPSKKNEQKGLGLIYPQAGLMDMEWQLLNREALAGQYYTFPFFVYKDEGGNLLVAQVKPTRDSYGIANEVQVLTPTPNFQMTESLLGRIDQSISKLALAEVSFGEGADVSSGYQVSLLSSGPMRRIEDELSQYQRMRERQYGVMLRHIEEWADADGAKRCGITGDANIAAYLKAWSTVSAATPDPKKKKNLNRAYLTASDVEGYGAEDIRVNLIPETPQDENAKYQRAQMALQAGMPQKWVTEQVIKADNPAEVQMWIDEEKLEEANPLWGQFRAEQTRIAILEKEKLGDTWNKFMLAQGKNPDGSPITPEATTPTDPNMPTDMSQDPNQMPQAINPQGGFVPDMAGMPPQMMPPAEAGMLPGQLQGATPNGMGGY